MGVMRLGYVHSRQTDLPRSVAYYTDTLGMKVTHVEGDGRTYLKAWDEHDHHSVVLEGGGVGVVKLGYKCAREDDLNTFENRAQQFGCLTERMAKGENIGIGDGVRVILPSDHVLELYAEADYLGSELGNLNPKVALRNPIGASVPRLDHAVITAEDPLTMERFFAECLDFRPTERIVDNLDDENLLGSFMACGNSPHDIAILPGPNGKLHHFAFECEDWHAVLRSGQIFGDDDVTVEEGPKQHGITRGQTVYMFDPSGNRNEVFAGGYRVFEDTKPITWTSDQLAKGVFYVGTEMSETFLNSVT